MLPELSWACSSKDNATNEAWFYRTTEWFRREEILEVSMQLLGPSRTWRLDQALMAHSSRGLKSSVDGECTASMLACSFRENVFLRIYFSQLFKTGEWEYISWKQSFPGAWKKNDEAFLPLPHMASLRSAGSWARAMAFLSIKSLMDFTYWVSIGLYTVVLKCRWNLLSQSPLFSSSLC